MCSELKKMLKPVCLWQWCFNFRSSGSKSFTFQRPPNIRGELSEKLIFSVQVLKVVIIWSWGVGVKTGSSSSSACPALLLPCPLLFPHLYRMISEKEIEWFLWRASWFCAMEEVYRSQSVSRFLIFTEDYAPLVPFLITQCPIGVFFPPLLSEKGHDHNSAR